MAKEILTIHSETPELRKIRKVCDALRDGAVILYPTDTGFSFGCNLANREGVERIRKIRKMNNKKRMTFLCDSLSNIAEFAKVSDSAYRALKRLIPGPYTFILPASRQIPKYAVDTKRKNTGIRVPDNILSQLLLRELNNPMISISAKINDEFGYQDPDEVFDTFGNFVDIAVVSDDYNFVGPSTIFDMTTDHFVLIRRGAGFEKALENIDFVEE